MISESFWDSQVSQFSFVNVINGKKWKWLNVLKIPLQAFYHIRPLPPSLNLYTTCFSCSLCLLTDIRAMNQHTLSFISCNDIYEGRQNVHTEKIKYDLYPGVKWRYIIFYTKLEPSVCQYQTYILIYRVLRWATKLPLSCSPLPPWSQSLWYS